MSDWRDLDLQARVVDVLSGVHLNNPDGHHFGRPFLTAYQLAIEIDRRHPEILDALGLEVGGAGAGRNSFARYVARQLSGEIRRHWARYPVEGAFISNADVVDFRFRRANGEEVISSSSRSSIDLSMFRLR